MPFSDSKLGYLEHYISGNHCDSKFTDYWLLANMLGLSIYVFTSMRTTIWKFVSSTRLQVMMRRRSQEILLSKRKMIISRGSVHLVEGGCQGRNLRVFHWEGEIRSSSLHQRAIHSGELEENLSRFKIFHFSEKEAKRKRQLQNSARLALVSKTSCSETFWWSVDQKNWHQEIW